MFNHAKTGFSCRRHREIKMGFKYIHNDAQAKLKQINLKVNEDVFIAYEAVRDEMYIKGKTLTVAQAVEEILKNATRVGAAWLKDNADAPDVKKRKANSNKKKLLALRDAEIE